MADLICFAEKYSNLTIKFPLGLSAWVMQIKFEPDPFYSLLLLPPPKS
jgi:hypothetical protein